jgi:signal peptidase I
MFMGYFDYLKRFWNFLKEDTWQSWIVSLVLLILIVKFIFFPIMSFVTGTSLPLVIVESCSMYHGQNFDDWWSSNGVWYQYNNITKEQFREFSFSNGLNKGDIIFVLGKKDVPKIGEVTIFAAGSKYPLIHRVVNGGSVFGTKGDHNLDQLKKNNNAAGLDETAISEDAIMGVARYKVAPYLGWIKLIWFEPFKSSSERGFCK